MTMTTHLRPVNSTLVVSACVEWSLVYTNKTDELIDRPERPT